MEDNKRVDSGGLETQLFSWDGWDGESDCMIFYNPILKVQVGKFPAGTKFDVATLLLDKLQLENYGPEIVEGHVTRREVAYIAEYNLKLSIDSVIKE